jgi:hypothetical protein
VFSFLISMNQMMTPTLSTPNATQMFMRALLPA